MQFLVLRSIQDLKNRRQVGVWPRSTTMIWYHVWYHREPLSLENWSFLSHSSELTSDREGEVAQLWSRLWSTQCALELEPYRENIGSTQKNWAGRLKNIEPSSILNQGFNCFSSLYIFAEKGAKGIGTSPLLKMSPGNSNSNLNHPLGDSSLLHCASCTVYKNT